MKATVYDLKGEKKGEIVMPKMFDSHIREDIVAKYVESDKFMQPYWPDPRAGRKHSAAGTVKHARHRWKGHYGRGVSRVPKKQMWRRGTQFFWVGAEVSGTRGGRRAHGPKGLGTEKRINKKERVIALNSGFAATASSQFIRKRYQSLSDFKVNLPIVIDSSVDKAKTKLILQMLKTIFGDVYHLVTKQRRVRAGKGKQRGRKYKSNAGLLFVTSADEKIRVSGVDVKAVPNIRINDLYPLGRLAVYTEKAVQELDKKGVKV